MVSGIKAGILVVGSREQVKNLISDSWNRYLISSLTVHTEEWNKGET